MEVRTADVQGIRVVQLAGVVDEGHRLAQIADRVAGRTVLIDAARVTRLTSFGVRDLVNWVNDVEGNHAALHWARVSTALVAQARMVPNLFGRRARVLSVLAPYYCEACDREDSLLVTTIGRSGPIELPAPRCSECGEAQELDEIEDDYLRFLESLPDAPVEAAVMAIAARFRPVTPGE